MIDMNICVKSDTVEASNVELSVKMSIIYALNEEYIFVYFEKNAFWQVLVKLKLSYVI